MTFLNSASSAAVLVLYLPGVWTHTDTEGRRRKAGVRNILKSSKETQYLMNTLYFVLLLSYAYIFYFMNIEQEWEKYQGGHPRHPEGRQGPGEDTQCPQFWKELWVPADPAQANHSKWQTSTKGEETLLLLKCPFFCVNLILKMFLGISFQPKGENDLLIERGFWHIIFRPQPVIHNLLWLMIPDLWNNIGIINTISMNSFAIGTKNGLYVESADYSTNWKL